MSHSEIDHKLREEIAAARADLDRAHTYGRTAGQIMRAHARYEKALVALAAHREAA